MKKMMRRTALVLFMALVSAFAVISAQTPEALVDLVRRHAADSSVVVSYKMEVLEDGKLTKDAGVLEAQDGLWHLKGSSVEIYTDAQATWILDPDAKEAVVEPAWTYSDLLDFYESLMKMGVAVDVQVTSMHTGAKRPVSEFTPSCGPDWVVTDLR